MKTFSLTYVKNRDEEIEMDVQAENQWKAMNILVAACCPWLKDKLKRGSVGYDRRHEHAPIWDITVNVGGSARIGYDGHVRYFGNYYGE